jgi:maltose O-acetyltransferase
MSDQKSRMLRGELYQASDPELVAERLACQDLLERFNGLSTRAIDEHREILGSLLGGFGPGSEIMSPFLCDYGYQIRMGVRSFVNYGAIMLDVASITIGDEVQIATSVQLLTATHPLEAATRRAGWESGEPITIDDGAWLGSGVIVCPGVHIGKNAVVGAGSVVTKDIPPNVLAVGNPCRVIRELNDSDSGED